MVPYKLDGTSEVSEGAIRLAEVIVGVTAAHVRRTLEPVVPIDLQESRSDPGG